MVLGREVCGAVKGACDIAEMGNLTVLLEKTQPAVDAVKGDFPEDQQNSPNLDFVNKVVEENVRITVANIRKDSPVLADLEKTGDIKIVDAIYSLHTGEVTVLDYERLLKTQQLSLGREPSLASARGSFHFQRGALIT